MPPSEFIPSSGDELPIEKFAALYDSLVKQHGFQGHVQLGLDEQEINRHMRVRIAGCDDEGNELGEAAVERDAAIIDLLHSPQVVTAVAIADQMQRFRQRLDAVGGDYLQLDSKEFDWMELGGHMQSNVLPELLPEIVRGRDEKTYALITEYVHGEGMKEVRIPFAYHFGFTQMPEGDMRFPNFEPSDIAGKNGRFAAENAAHIWTPWRVGVLRELTPDVCAQLEKLNVVIPDYMKGRKGGRRGLNNAYKAVYGQAAQDLNKKYIMYNTAVLQPPGDVAIGMPNKALRESNRGMFLDLGKRNHVDAVTDEKGNVVAEAEWSVFGNTPASLLKAVFRDEGVLKGKGGYEDTQSLLRVGHVLADVTKRRQGIFQ